MRQYSFTHDCECELSCIIREQATRVGGWLSGESEKEKHIKTTLKIQFYEIFPIQKIKKHF